MCANDSQLPFLIVYKLIICVLHDFVVVSLKLIDRGAFHASAVIFPKVAKTNLLKDYLRTALQFSRDEVSSCDCYDGTVV